MCLTRAFISTSDCSDRRIALRNKTGGWKKNEEIIGEETPEQRGLQRAKRFLGHMLVQKGAEAGVIVLIYTIRHPIRWVRNSTRTVVTPSYITVKPVDSALWSQRHTDCNVAETQCAWEERGFEVKGVLKCLQVTLNRALESSIQYWMVLYLSFQTN